VELTPEQTKLMLAKKQQLIDLLKRDTGLLVEDILAFDSEKFEGTLIAEQKEFIFKMTAQKTIATPVEK